MTTKQEVMDILKEMRDDHYEAKREAFGEAEANHHRASAAALQMALVRVSEEIEE